MIMQQRMRDRGRCCVTIRGRSALRWSMSRTQIFEKGILQKRTQLRATK
jgi:hypothetical protein